MKSDQKIHSALLSVFDKDGLAPIAKALHNFGVQLYSTGGTQAYITKLGIPVTAVEELTSFPSILGGRVKTLHPKIFGGILNRQTMESDVAELAAYAIPQIDLVIVDLYPFEKTVANHASNADEIIEKIDIGGISLIRAAAKNYAEVTCVASVHDYPHFLRLLEQQNGSITLDQRKDFATKAFAVSSHYDTTIFSYFNNAGNDLGLKISEPQSLSLRYGENPHQKGYFYGDLNSIFDQLHGKSLSYNNLLDVDAAVRLMAEFSTAAPVFAILKHNNACGLSQRENIYQAYCDALAADPVSAFGGVLISNATIDVQTATEIHKLFCEVVIAPDFEPAALAILTKRKNRILLRQKNKVFSKKQIRTCLGGFLVQDADNKTDEESDLKLVTNRKPSAKQIEDLLFASKISKHTKSNTIVLAKDKQLLASGTGQTSRIDALKQAIEKAQSFDLNLQDAVMASDAFFPFPDCVALAHQAGIQAVIQPGGSIKDQQSIAYCDANDLTMVMTGMRHFKH